MSSAPSIDETKNLGASTKCGLSPTLIKASSTRFPNPLPWHYRTLGSAVATMCALVFYLGPLFLILPLFVGVVSSRAAVYILIFDAWLVFWPSREWPWIRGVFQILYERFDLCHNLKNGKNGNGSEFETLHRDHQSIFCMHPHGVVPIQGYLFSAVCDQYIHDMYGYGGVTDIAARLPFLGNVLGWVGAGSASRDAVRKQLDTGRNLYMMPGGVAEIFLSESGTHKVKARRYGLMKLALQSGTCLIPMYVFGGNEFFDHLATYGNKSSGNSSSGSSSQKNTLGLLLEQFSRTMKGGFTLFWGCYGLPIPYPAKVSMVFGDPVWPVPNTLTSDVTTGKFTCRRVPNPTNEQISELLDRYVDALRCLFEQYKGQAGCPDATLEIQ